MSVESCIYLYTTAYTVREGIDHGRHATAHVTSSSAHWVSMASVLVPVAYLIIIFGGLFVFSYFYRKHTSSLSDYPFACIAILTCCRKSIRAVLPIASGTEYIYHLTAEKGPTAS